MPKAMALIEPHTVCEAYQGFTVVLSMSLLLRFVREKLREKALERIADRRRRFRLRRRFPIRRVWVGARHARRIGRRRRGRRVKRKIADIAARDIAVEVQSFDSGARPLLDRGVRL